MLAYMHLHVKNRGQQVHIRYLSQLVSVVFIYLFETGTPQLARLFICEISTLSCLQLRPHQHHWGYMFPTQ